MFDAMLRLDDGKTVLTRTQSYQGRLPQVLVWQSTDNQGQPWTRVFIHDPSKAPDGSSEYVPHYLETVSLNVTVDDTEVRDG